MYPTFTNDVVAVVRRGDTFGAAVYLVEDLVEEDGEEPHPALIAPDGEALVMVAVEDGEAEADERRARANRFSKALFLQKRGYD